MRHRRHAEWTTTHASDVGVARAVAGADAATPASAAAPPQFSGRSACRPSLRWIAIHLPALSLESFAATLSAADRARPLALVDQHRVTQVDAKAAALGVQVGAKRATALALAGDLILGQAEAVRDAQALRAVVFAGLAFTPNVCVDVTADVPVVLLEVQSCLRYFGGHRRLLQRLQDEALRPLGHRWQIASAQTPLGAALLARWRDDLADGAHCRDPSALRTLLDEAPPWLLGPGREHWEALQGMGLTRLSDLRHLPRTGLARRFGPALLADLDRACGDVPDPREPIEPPPRFEQRLELFTRADNAEQLLAGARVLLARMLAWAGARQGRIVRFTLVAHHETRARGESLAPGTLDIALAEPSADLAHLQSLLAERLARWPLAAPALELSLRCDDLVHAPPPNGELFASRRSEREGLTRLIERLQARLGADGVQQLVRVADHRPERAMAWAPARTAPEGASRLLTSAAGSPSSSPVSSSSAPSSSLSIPPRSGSALLPAAAGGVPTLVLPRPLWLLDQPVALHERAAQPWLDGAPLQVLAGPERIESGWWDGALAARDYFIARARDGALVWIYRARLPLHAADGGGWFLQGRFA